MEEHVIRLLQETQSSQETSRKNAEWQLKQQYDNLDFPVALISIGSHDGVALDVRQSALLYLKTFILACWSTNYSTSEKKAQIRQSLLDLSLSGPADRKIKNAASLAVGKIANSDFPEEWPDLLPTVLHTIVAGEDSQLHGALKVLSELVDDSLSEEQFLQIARNLVNAIYEVAVSESRSPVLRALAVSVFRSCFDTLEMIMENHKADVKAFADENLANWIPFFTTILKSPLPSPPIGDQGRGHEPSEIYRGWVALKLQVVKVLMRVRSLFPAILSPHSPALFSATWQELSTLQSQYREMYIENDRQGRLEDADGLPYTLDFLVLEELDFMQACLRAPPIRKELEQQLQAQSDITLTWITDMMKIMVAYAHITVEEEGLWEIDVNVFLSEEANVTTNYTPRTACGDLIIKLSEWLYGPTVEGLLAYTRTLHAENVHWKAKEACLYLLNQLLGDLQDLEKKMGTDAAKGYVDFIQNGMQEESDFLRARGFLVAGSLTRVSDDALQPVAATFMEASLAAIRSDPSDIVKVSCIRALQYYLAAIPSSTTVPQQANVIAALSHFLHSQDLSDLTDSDDLLMAIIETLRDAILLNPSTCVNSGGLDLLFLVSGQGASNFQLALFVSETFEEIVIQINELGPDQYAHLVSKVVPSLMASFDVATLTEENDLANLSAELLSVLARHGVKPMPAGFVGTVMPRLNRLLLGSTDDELLKSATTAVKYLLHHDPEQIFNFQDHNGKGGLEVILVIIDRLLGPAVDDNGASEVGSLAAEVVEKAGAERLGPYLQQLLQAVAARIPTATQPQFIQSLILVFARMILISAREVVDFLSQIQVGDQSGLYVVLSKWLENSISFAGYDDIRQNVAALSKLYDLHDQRVVDMQVKGDLIVPKSDRIMTRSRAKQTPDQYTVISAQLKIVKVLVEEFLPASSGRELDAEAAANLLDEDEDEDDWEDEPNEFVDLSTGMTKSQLMALVNDDNGSITARGRDDDTQTYLVNFFHEAAQKPEFQQIFSMLSAEEQEKLQTLGGA